jgi:hypothetical protein
MADDQLAKIQARADAATPGPWKVDFTDDDGDVRPNNACTVRDGRGRLMMRIEEAENKADILFLMHAREDVPRLLSTVEYLRRQVAVGEHVMKPVQHGELAATERIAALEAIALRVAATPGRWDSSTGEYWCLFCSAVGSDPTTMAHTPQCLVTQARTLLGKE